MQSLALLAPAVAAILAVLARDRVTSILIVFVYLSLEGLFKLMGNYHPIVHIGVDIAFLSLVGFWLLKAMLEHRSGLPRVPMFWILVLHVTWIMLLILSPYTASMYAGIVSLKIHLAMIPMYFVGYVLAADRDMPRRFMRGMVIVWTAAFGLTMLQYVLGPYGLFDLGAAYMQRLEGFHEWRPFGTTALPGGEAIYAMLALPFALALLFRRNYRLTDPWIVAVVLGSFAVFFVSGVRQVFVGAVIIVVGMSAVEFIRGRTRVAGTMVGVVALAAVGYLIVAEYAVPAAQTSIAELGGPDIWSERTTVERFESLLNPDTYSAARHGSTIGGGIELIADRATTFPFGAGLGRTGPASAVLQSELTADPMGQIIQEQYSFQDNFFAAMIVETGIPGAVMLTVMLLGFGVMSVRLARRARNDEDAALGALCAGYMLALLVLSWGSQPLLTNPTMAFFWFLAGMMARRLRATDDVGETEPVPVAPQPSAVDQALF